MIIETQSLFDYLGRPAGSDLGQKVHAAAVGKGVYIGKIEELGSAKAIIY